jgi:hypothetical protein
MASKKIKSKIVSPPSKSVSADSAKKIIKEYDSMCKKDVPFDPGTVLDPRIVLESMIKDNLKNV